MLYGKFPEFAAEELVRRKVSGQLDVRPEGLADVAFGMDELALWFLDACSESLQRRLELLPSLCAATGIEASQLLYQWKLRSHPRLRSSGTLGGGEWRYFFHGLECDLKQISDGRFLRIDFGPRGRLDTITAWGVLQFVMTARPPWREYSSLHAYLAQGTPPYTEFSGSLTRASSLFQQLLDERGVDVSDPELVALVEANTVISADSAHEVHLPADLPETVWLDSLVSHRYVISHRGYEILGARARDGQNAC